jgi:hypothetical protein
MKILMLISVVVLFFGCGSNPVVSKDSPNLTSINSSQSNYQANIVASAPTTPTPVSPNSNRFSSTSEVTYSDIVGKINEINVKNKK